MSKNNMAIIIVIAVAFVAVLGAVYLYNGNNHDDSQGIIGTYILQDDCVRAIVTDDGIVFEEGIKESRKVLTINHFEKDGFRGTLGEDTIVGVYANGVISISMDVTKDGVRYSDYITGTIKNNVVTLNGIGYCDGVLHDAYCMHFVKEWSKGTPERFNNLWDAGDSASSFSMIEDENGTYKIYTSPEFVFKISVTKRVGLVYVFEETWTYEEYSYKKVTLGVQCSDDLIVTSVGDQPGRLSFDGDLRVLLYNSANMETKSAYTINMSDDGEEVKFKDLPDLSGLVYSGTHITVSSGKVSESVDTTSFGRMKGNIVEAVSAQKGTLLMQVIPVENGYRVFYNNAFENGGRDVSCSISGFISKDLKQMTLMTSTHASENVFSSSKMTYTLQDTESSIIGIYDTEYFNVLYYSMDISGESIGYDEYFTVETVKDGIVTGSCYGYRYVGTMIDGTLLIPLSGYGYYSGNATVIFNENGCTIYTCGCVNYSMASFASEASFKKVGTKTTEDETNDPIFVEGDMYKAYTMIFRVGDVDFEASSDMTIKCLKTVGNIYSFVVTQNGGTEIYAMSGFSIKNANLAWMCILMEDTYKYVVLNKHDDFVCMDMKDTNEEGLSTDTVWRMTPNGEQPQTPMIIKDITKTEFSGKMNGGAIVNGKKYSSEMDIKLKITNQNSTIVTVTLDDKTVNGHLIVNNEGYAVGITFEILYMFEGSVPYLLKYVGMFSDDGKTLSLQSSGYTSEGYIFATKSILT